MLCRLFGVMLTLIAVCDGQVTTGQIEGTVLDPGGAAVNGASASLRNLDTGATASCSTDSEGRFRFPQLPIGTYEVAVEKASFSRYVRGPVILRLNQNAFLGVKLELGTVSDRITVIADAPLLNVTTAEIGVNFDRQRISELPLASSRNVLSLALSAAGVSQLQTGQSTGLNTGSSIPFSVNGMRARSNNFMIDGQDANSQVLTGLAQQLNNPDVIAEFRLIANQFAAEYGRTAGSVVNIITRSGTNQVRGSAFWFFNNNHLNAPSNLDNSISPFRIEHQFGGSLGGPVVRDKTFFFGSLQRWTDRSLGGGRSITGPPTADGRSALESIAGTRPAVRIFLDNVPAAPVADPLGRSSPVTAGGRSVDIPWGVLSGSSNTQYEDWQGFGRVEHSINERHRLGGRYLLGDRLNSGTGQVVPPGLTQIQPQRQQSATAYLNSVFSPTVFHELRLSFVRSESSNTAANPDAGSIPSIEVSQLGLTGTSSGLNRTGLGLAADLPRITNSNRYQLQSTLGVQHGSHATKFGADFRREEVNQVLQLIARGSLVYANLQDLVDDTATSARINSPLPGGSGTTYYKQYEQSFFVQDEWRPLPALSLTYGIRYESIGNPLEGFRRLSERIVANQGGDQRFILAPIPPRDRNNWAPRFGLNFRFPSGPGFLKVITRNEALVARAGYARTYDFPFLQVIAQVANSFPLVKSDSLSQRTTNALSVLQQLAAAPVSGDPARLARDLPSGDLRAPFAEQFSFQLQRGFQSNWLLSVGYVGTKGTALLQQIDANPVVPASGGKRVDPNSGVRTTRCLYLFDISLASNQSGAENVTATNPRRSLHLEHPYRWRLRHHQPGGKWRTARSPGLLQSPGGSRPIRVRPAAQVRHEWRVGASVLRDQLQPVPPAFRGMAGEWFPHPAIRSSIHCIGW